MKFDPCLDFTLREEGGYQCLQGDAGNWSSGVCNSGRLVGTNMGISAPVLTDWVGGEVVDIPYMKALQRPTVVAIYGAKYRNPIHGPALPAGVDLMVFDHAVNAGVQASARLLQQLVGVTPDGWIGDKTVAAVNECLPGNLIEGLRTRQELFYRSLPAGMTPIGHGRKFLNVWLDRLKRRRDAAWNLVGK